MLLELKSENLEKIEIFHNGNTIEASTIGVSKVDIQDAAGANSYHIPEGILIDYNPKLRDQHFTSCWKSVSVLDYSPSILKEFGVPKMPYIVRDNRLFS